MCVLPIKTPVGWNCIAKAVLLPICLVLLIADFPAWLQICSLVGPLKPHGKNSLLYTPT